MAKAAEAFRTISEVADELELHKHVLRFWEIKFPQIKPMKRGGGRRYYRPADVELLRGIRHLLHAEGYTIKGVQRILRERGIDAVKRVGVEVMAKAEGAAARAGLVPEGKRAAQSQRGSEDGAATRRRADQGTRESGNAATSKDVMGQAAGAGRIRSISDAIAELEACRDILKGVDAATAADTAVTAKSKRAMRAAG